MRNSVLVSIRVHSWFPQIGRVLALQKKVLPITRAPIAASFPTGCRMLLLLYLYDSVLGFAVGQKLLFGWPEGSFLAAVDWLDFDRPDKLRSHRMGRGRGPFEVCGGRT